MTCFLEPTPGFSLSEKFRWDACVDGEGEAVIPSTGRECLAQANRCLNHDRGSPVLSTSWEGV